MQRALTLLALLGAALVACSPGIKDGGSSRLEPSMASVELTENARGAVAVRCVNEDGSPLSGVPVRFSITDDPDKVSGAKLTRDSAATGSDGIATVQLEVAAEGTFRVLAEIGDGQVVEIIIRVIKGASQPSETNLIEPFDPAMEMLEYEERTIRVRYTDQEGLPIAAASIRFRIQPAPSAANGAVLLSRVAVTGEDGVASVRLKAREEAAFLIEADADGAEEPARINVSVSNDSGGRIDVSVYQTSAVTMSEADVLLVDDLRCANFDAFEPPPAIDDGVNTRQTVSTQPGKASNLTFRGLEPGRAYTVAAIGRAGDQVVARGCREGIFITEEMIDQRRIKSVAVDLQDITGPLSNELAVVTTFSSGVGLAGVAGLLKSMAGSANGLADYVMNQMTAHATDSDVKRLLEAQRQPISAALAGSAGEAQRSRLLLAANALASVHDVRLHSRIDFRDEDDGVITDELSIKHRLYKLSGVMLANDEQMVRRDFPLFALADPRVSSRRRVFGGSALKLKDTAVMRVQDDARVAIAPHQMSLPIADAIMGQILFDHFGYFNLERIFGQMVGCDEAGGRADEYAQKMGLADSDRVSRLLEGGSKGLLPRIYRAVTELCQDEVRQILTEVQRRTQEDLKSFPADRFIVFEGSAEVLMLGDGVTIGWLKNGNWTGLGTFEATRD